MKPYFCLYNGRRLQWQRMNTYSEWHVWQSPVDHLCKKTAVVRVKIFFIFLQPIFSPYEVYQSLSELDVEWQLNIVTLFPILDVVTVTADLSAGISKHVGHGGNSMFWTHKNWRSDKLHFIHNGYSMPDMLPSSYQAKYLRGGRAKHDWNRIALSHVSPLKSGKVKVPKASFIAVKYTQFVL